MSFVRRHKKKLVALAVAVLGPFAMHGAILALTPIDPPSIARVDERCAQGPAGLTTVGASYTRVRQGLREVFLEGSPEDIGRRHALLLHDHMVSDEAEVWASFEHFVPIAAARALITDVSRLRYRHVDEGFPPPRRLEVAAEAQAFAPFDPFTAHMPTYQRFVFLHSLYDIALSFEHSPLLGCSAFALGAEATRDGHVLLARAFDFEAGEVFDRDKAVFFVKSADPAVIPFASVAWPGLVGVMTGMNLEGVTAIVNGARAGDPQVSGEPVVFMMRDVLERAHDTGEAIAILKKQSPMVSHIVFLADPKGRFAVVERAPGREAFVREKWPDPQRVGVTNHFEGPLAGDPKNLAVEAHTTTEPRLARLDEMLAEVKPRSADVARAISMLRDHTCAKGAACALGDRRAIDALIATHGVVADGTARALWVSAGPHLSGRFVRFDLRAIFAEGHDPSRDPEPDVIDEDPILSDGRYREGRARAGGPRVGGDAP